MWISLYCLRFKRLRQSAGLFCAAARFKVLIDEGENMQKIDRDIKLAQSGALALTKEYWMKTYGFREEEVG